MEQPFTALESTMAAALAMARQLEEENARLRLFNERQTALILRYEAELRRLRAQVHCEQMVASGAHTRSLDETCLVTSD